MNRLPTRRVGELFVHPAASAPSSANIPSTVSQVAQSVAASETPVQTVPEIRITASPPPDDTTKAALAAGAAVGLVAVAVAGAPLWAGILLGAGGTLLTKAVISNAA